MVLEVRADSREVGHHVEAQATQGPGGADPGAQQQVRGPDRARGQDHLAGRRGLIRPSVPDGS